MEKNQRKIFVIMFVTMNIITFYLTFPRKKILFQESSIATSTTPESTTGKTEGKSKELIVTKFTDSSHLVTITSSSTPTSMFNDLAVFTTNSIEKIEAVSINFYQKYVIPTTSSILNVLSDITSFSIGTVAAFLISASNLIYTVITKNKEESNAKLGFSVLEIDSPTTLLYIGTSNINNEKVLTLPTNVNEIITFDTVTIFETYNPSSDQLKEGVLELPQVDNKNASTTTTNLLPGPNVPALPAPIETKLSSVYIVEKNTKPTDEQSAAKSSQQLSIATKVINKTDFKFYKSDDDNAIYAVNLSTNEIQKLPNNTKIVDINKASQVILYPNNDDLAVKQYSNLTTNWFSNFSASLTAMFYDIFYFFY